MPPSTTPSGHTAVTALRRYVRKHETSSASVERCELCSVALPSKHRHLLEMPARSLVCVCTPCALLFENVVGGRYKLIPRDAVVLPDFRMSDVQWASLALPIHLAFLFRQTPQEGVTAFYPSPAGATESLLTLSAWQDLVAENPLLSTIQSDVEALLINRVGYSRDYFLAPIDVCFELVGLVRTHWRGLSGGSEVWSEIERFFEELRARSKSQATDGGRHA